jgi:hypothetical protein
LAVDYLFVVTTEILAQSKARCFLDDAVVKPLFSLSPSLSA